MSSMTTSVFTAGTSACSSMGAVARRALSAIGGWLQSQRDYRLLCQMEESGLRDLGLTASDLRDATAAGLFGDPTSIIAGRANERRGASR